MSQTRQLAAILFADIVGFTRIMQEDERKANTQRKKLYQTLEGQSLLHQGKILKFSGDGILCMFQSPIEAVRAAISIQEVMQQDPQVPLRIGIHQGDIIIDDNDIFGDGVNLAARLESFAIPGSIFISAKVRDELKNQGDIKTQSLGKLLLKNVVDPVEVYAVANAGLNIPSIHTLVGKGQIYNDPQRPINLLKWGLLSIVILLLLAYIYQQGKRGDLPIEKSIAVLPFTHLGGDTTPLYFTDGVTEDILNQLSQITDLKVKSSSASFAYRESNLSLKKIGQNLNVSVILQGNIQRQGNLLRFIANLINCETEEIIWSERYDRNFDDIFKVQNEIAIQIASTLRAKLSNQERTRINSRSTRNPAAYEYYLEARNILKDPQAGRIDLSRALKLTERAIQLDPSFGAAHDLKGSYWISMIRFGVPYP